MDVGTVLVWDTQTLQTVSIIRGKNTTAFSVLFDTSSSLLISFENGLERWVFRESNNAERPLRKKRDWRINQSIAREMVVTSDGRYLLTSSFDSKLTCWDLETQQVKWEQRASLPCVRSVEISRDEKTFVCHADANTITVRDMETGEPEVWLMDQDMGTGTGARFSLDGNLLYTTSSDGLVRIWTIPGQSLIGTIVTTSL
jgi:WD40 repeat protein